MSSIGPTPSAAQACAVPFRIRAGRIEVCLVTSMKKGKWMLPKGFVEPKETAEQAALKEAWEEAGLKGQIVGELIMRYEHRKSGSRLAVDCFLMFVEQSARDWPEAAMRRRDWVTLDDAKLRLSSDGQRLALVTAAELLKRRRSKAG